VTLAVSSVVHALSFDVEDWYQGFVYRNIPGWENFASREKENVERILDLLDEFKTQATFFVLGKFAESHPDVVRLISSRGHEVASHGYVHKPIPRFGREGFQEDLRRSLDVLEPIIGSKISGYRAASWSLTRDCDWALDILAEEGLKYDSSVFPTRLHKYGYPGARSYPHMISLPSGKSIYEFPAQVLSLGPIRFPAAGGFYLRAFPLFASTWALKQSDRKLQSGMVYLHPFDLDAAVPVLKTGPIYRIIRYYNLEKTESYLRRLLNEFSFSSLRRILTSLTETDKKNI
jgi:polysaccharide deacetylase family protein (PEP-CTERM system associated)